MPSLDTLIDIVLNISSKVQFNFITIHYTYIILCILLSSAIIYITGSVRYIDALLLSSGAATQSGLNPVDLNRLHTMQQVGLWFVAMITNVIFINSSLVLVRLYWFRRRFRNVIREVKSVSRYNRKRYMWWGGDSEDPTMSRRYGTMLGVKKTDFVRRSMGSVIPPQDERRGVYDTGECNSTSAETIMTESEEEQPLLDAAMEENERRASTDQCIGCVSAVPPGPHISIREPARLQRETSHRSEPVSTSDLDNCTLPLLPSLHWQSTIASYSDWNEAQKNELGGIEYRALKTLFFILIGYLLIFHLLGVVLLSLWIHLNRDYAQVIAETGIDESWWAVFTTGSAFNDLGFTLTPDSMASFNRAAFPLLVMTFLIVVGNTGFPCMLRLIIWMFSKAAEPEGPIEEELRFLLERPRRCFTLLFPRADTWRLFWVLVLLNTVDLSFFLLLDRQQGNNPPSPAIWFINGLFQIASTRTAGFSVVSLSDLHPAVQVSFIVMMYISAFPTTMVMRRTNIYEENSLAIYSDDNDMDSGNRTTLARHMQQQLGFDLWYVFVGLFLIAIIEGDRLRQGHEPAFSMFSILFEVVSAYGTVGLSLGGPKTETSLCGQFRPLSKLVIVAMQVRGRHRGLPFALDRAVSLPYELNR